MPGKASSWSLVAELMSTKAALGAAAAALAFSAGFAWGCETAAETASTRTNTAKAARRTSFLSRQTGFRIAEGLPSGLRRMLDKIRPDVKTESRAALSRRQQRHGQM